MGFCIKRSVTQLLLNVKVEGCTKRFVLRKNWLLCFPGYCGMNNV